jgi:hypothetical protein
MEPKEECPFDIEKEDNKVAYTYEEEEVTRGYCWHQNKRNPLSGIIYSEPGAP